MMLTIVYQSPTEGSENPTITIRSHDDSGSSSAAPIVKTATLTIEGHQFDIISESTNLSFAFDQDTPTRLLLELAIRLYLIPPGSSSISVDPMKHRAFESLAQSYFERGITYILNSRALDAAKTFKALNPEWASVTRVYPDHPDTHQVFNFKFMPRNRGSDNIIIMGILCFPDNELSTFTENETYTEYDACILDIPAYQINVNLKISKTIAKSLDFQADSLKNDLKKNTAFLSEVTKQLSRLDPVACPEKREEFTNNIATFLISYLEPILQEYKAAQTRLSMQ